MIKNSKEWARARGLLAINPVHGAEEWKCPTDHEFEFINKKGASHTQTGHLTFEDECGSLHACNCDILQNELLQLCVRRTQMATCSLGTGQVRLICTRV